MVSMVPFERCRVRIQGRYKIAMFLKGKPKHASVKVDGAVRRIAYSEIWKMKKKAALRMKGKLEKTQAPNTQKTQQNAQKALKRRAGFDEITQRIGRYRSPVELVVQKNCTLGDNCVHDSNLPFNYKDSCVIYSCDAAIQHFQHVAARKITFNDDPKDVSELYVKSIAKEVLEENISYIDAPCGYVINFEENMKRELCLRPWECMGDVSLPEESLDVTEFRVVKGWETNFACCLNSLYWSLPSIIDNFRRTGRFDNVKARCEQKFTPFDLFSNSNSSHIDGLMSHAVADGFLHISSGSVVDFTGHTIVNAANKQCLGGGGVDGAVHKAAGFDLYVECLSLPLIDEQTRCNVGSAVATNAHKLKCESIIHAVGPNMNDQREHNLGLLYSAYKKSMELAKSLGSTTVAFSILSGGIFRGAIPLKKIIRIALSAIKMFKPNEVQRVHLVCFTEEEGRVALAEAQDMSRLHAFPEQPSNL